MHGFCTYVGAISLQMLTTALIAAGWTPAPAWRPIETAPTDVVILGRSPEGKLYLGTLWRCGEWYCVDSYIGVAHWAPVPATDPLPTPPAEAGPVS